MKIQILLLFIIPLFSWAQIPRKELTNCVYNKIVNRQFSYPISYQMILAQKIRCIKYSSIVSDNMRYEYELDSLGQKRKKEYLKTEQVIDHFDSEGILINSSTNNCNDSILASASKALSKNTLELLNLLEQDTIPSLDFRDSLSGFALQFDAASKMMKVYPDWVPGIPLKYFDPYYFSLDEQFEIQKDSFYMRGVLCNDIISGHYYEYNDKGQLSKLIGFEASSYRLTYKYFENGNLSEIYVDDEPWATYHYTNGRLTLVTFSKKRGLQSIEIGY